MKDDIVERLRAWASTICSIRGDATPGRKSQMVCAAADEIERLRAELVSKADDLAATVRQLRNVEAERDEARREVSCLRPSVCLGAQTASEYARERGWDCFKEDGNAC